MLLGCEAAQGKGDKKCNSYRSVTLHICSVDILVFAEICKINVFYLGFNCSKISETVLIMLI